MSVGLTLRCWVAVGVCASACVRACVIDVCTGHKDGDGGANAAHKGEKVDNPFAAPSKL